MGSQNKSLISCIGKGLSFFLVFQDVIAIENRMYMQNLEIREAVLKK